ncbi:response regulator [Ktedonosporobacter rubrisoli]|uniref:histidine kinase n=2 Tax=Ktedonosporobacter rubrisoli TaxID=2509675 RepID=A0A4P6JZX9_KTERU|nr:response regulator [Ktedonosporobacter rubrisoli]
MSSNAGNSADRTNDAWESEGKNKSMENIDIIPAGFTREYRVLAEVCASMSSGFVLLNQQEHMVYSNPSAQRLLGLYQGNQATAEDFDIRQHLLSLVADPRQARSELELAWSHSEREYATDLALADVAVRWLRVRVFPVHSERGYMLGRGVIFDDITLERSALETRRETLALAAHELKTPLAIIKGCATTLLGGSARWDPAMQREMLQMIDAQSDRLYDVLNTLLDMWRLDTGAQPLRLTQVHIPELLQQLVKRWHLQAGSHRFVLDVYPSLPMVTCDVVRVEQALNHLLENAVTYSSSGSVVTIRAEANDVEVRIGVSDEGVGIAAEQLDRIFDRFYRGKQQEEHSDGSGLGLAAARATVEAHGGRIWADSLGVGQGATFYFTLPFMPRALTTAAPPAALVAGTAEVPALPKQSGRPALFRRDRRVRVLLAESDSRLTRYLRANLEEQQYRVQTVSHGVQFLRQLDLEEPDVILLSTRLADMSGVELLQRLREFSRTPVIMLADECDEDERVQIFDLGSDDLVVKPFGMKELLARVRALLRRQPSNTEPTNNQTNFSTGELTIDYAQHLVTVKGRTVQLSKIEYKLLSVLAQNVGMVVTHELLLEKVWGPEYNRDVDFIWVYISRLRRKLEEDSRRPKYIVTVPDVGYKLVKL